MGKIFYLADYGSPKNPLQAVVLPREFFHKKSIQVPTQEAFDRKIIISQAFTIFKNANVHNEEIILKAMSIGAFLVYYGFNIDLDDITIYKCVKTRITKKNRPTRHF